MNSYKRNKGVSLIEILVALLVTLIGILGFIGLQARSQQADLESFQREQALRIIDFMVNQINTNRSAAGCYGLATSVGTQYSGPFACTGGFGDIASRAQATADVNQWDSMLKGASESMTVGGTTTSVGGMIGARGCITYTAQDLTGATVVPNDTFTISVAWQGLTPGAEIPAGSCGSGQYGNTNLHRMMSVTITFADLRG